MQSLDTLRSEIALNYLGMVYCTYYALPHLKQSRGRVVGVSSFGALVGLPGFQDQEHGIKVVISRRLSVRQTEAWVKRYVPPRPRIPAASSRSALQKLAADLEAALGLEVKVTGSLRRGRVSLSYNSKEELQRLHDKLTS